MKQEREYHIQSFEGDSIPQNWIASREDSLELSKKHYKHGEQSLKWTFQSGDYLEIIHEEYMIEASHSKRGGLIAWIYNEKPIEECLKVSVGSEKQFNQENIPYLFNFYLNFKGWRALWVNFREDIINADFKGENSEAIEKVVFEAPVKEGVIYIDLVEFVDTIYQCRTQDYQIRTPRPDSIGRTFWQKSYKYIHTECKTPLEELSEKHIEDFELIEKRLEEWIMGTGKYIDEEPIQIRRKAIDEYIQDGIERYEALKIRKDEEGTITGVPLFASRAPYSPKFGVDVSTPIFLPLVFDYKLNNNQESLEKLLLLFDYYHDQGWAEGSGLGTLDHETNRSSGYFLAVYLMREELKKAGVFERECKTVEWFADLGKLNGEFGLDYIETTADEFRTHFLYRLLYVLTLETSPVKVRAMKNYLKWVNTALKVTHNFAGTIKPDYTGYHHRGIYASAYAPQGYHMVSLIHYILHGTLFGLDKEGVSNLKNALLTQDLLTKGLDLPQSLTGRFPEQTGIMVKILPAYAYMALAGELEIGADIDTQMGSIFKKHWNTDSPRLKEILLKECRAGISYIDTLGGIELMLDVANLDIKEAKDTEGFFIRPYGGLIINRWKDWAVSQKGWSQYIWDYESGGMKKENVFGRYVSYGALQIMAHDEPEKDGYAVTKGWDWNLVPGATTKYLSWENLSSEVNDYAHRTFTDETFLGGVSLEGSIGVFGMNLHDTQYDKSFRVKQSTFYFGDEIICLGSNINNEDCENPTQTTLFQAYLGEENQPGFHMKELGLISELGFEKTLKEDHPTWLMDPYGNGYWIAENQSIHIRRTEQKSRDSFDKEDTKGDYTTAVIQHGKVPQNGQFEYVIKVQTSKQEMEKYIKGYEVLRKDHEAHIIKYDTYKTVGYVLFEASEEIGEGILSATDTPILAMTKEVEEGVRLSVCDPDLRLPKLPTQKMTEKTAAKPSQKHKVTIKLKGKWEAKTQVEKIEQVGDHTIIEFICRDGKTIETQLIPV